MTFSSFFKKCIDLRVHLRFTISSRKVEVMKIKEVEKQLSMSSHTLRYYEKMGLINPQRDENGYRDYTFEDIEKLKKMHFLRELEIPIEDIIAIFEQSTDRKSVV